MTPTWMIVVGTAVTTLAVCVFAVCLASLSVGRTASEAADILDELEDDPLLAQETRCKHAFNRVCAGVNAADFEVFKVGYFAAIEREVDPVAAERDRYREALEEVLRQFNVSSTRGAASVHMANVASVALKAGKEGA